LGVVAVAVAAIPAASALATASNPSLFEETDMNLITHLTLDHLARLGRDDLLPHMIHAPWRTVKAYDQRRIHQRIDNDEKDFRGWRVSVESGQDRIRSQKSFYFSSHNDFSHATHEARQHRDDLEMQMGLVPWRAKKLTHLEDAFTVSGIVLSVGKRAPFWIYRQEGRRIIGSISRLGLRDSYLALAERVAEIEGFATVSADAPLPLFSTEQRQKLLDHGTSLQTLDAEAQHSRAWAIDFVNKQHKRAPVPTSAVA
jgi:hypothetical protein